MPRAQASITAIEATLAVLLVLSVTFAFSLGLPGEDAEAKAQLDTYAADGITLLVNEPPRHGDQTRLAELTASEDSFDREGAALEERVDRILPSNLLYRIETEHGSLGHPLPSGVSTGEATVLTTNGEVTLAVWYA